MMRKSLGQHSEHLRQKPLSNQEIANLAKDILQNHKKVQRSNEQIQNQLGKRSIKAIQLSGESCYMGACVDMTLLMFMKLQEKQLGDQIKICCEILKWKNDQRISLHIFLEDQSVSPSRIIDFVRKNEIKIYQGKYQNPNEGTFTEQIATFSCDGKDVTDEDSFFSLAKTMKIPFQESDFQAYLNKLKRDNTTENFKNFLKSSPLSIQIQETPHNTTEKALLETLSQEYFPEKK